MEGTRPDEWWIYERGIEPPDNQTSVLYDAGELSAREIKFLMPFWRRHHATALGFATEERAARPYPHHGHSAGAGQTMGAGRKHRRI
jgi:hypothetical protein